MRRIKKRPAKKSIVCQDERIRWNGITGLNSMATSERIKPQII